MCNLLFGSSRNYIHYSSSHNVRKGNTKWDSLNAYCWIWWAFKSAWYMMCTLQNCVLPPWMCFILCFGCDFYYNRHSSLFLFSTPPDFDMYLSCVYCRLYDAFLYTRQFNAVSRSLCTWQLFLKNPKLLVLRGCLICQLTVWLGGISVDLRECEWLMSGKSLFS